MLVSDPVDCNLGEYPVSAPVSVNLLTANGGPPAVPCSALLLLKRIEPPDGPDCKYN